MSTGSKIEWTETTWNPTLGCDRVSPGCNSCYAIGQAHMRSSNPNPKVAAAFAGTTRRVAGRTDWTGRVNLLPDRIRAPLTWRKPIRVFVDSMSDLFHKDVPDEYIARVFAVMAIAHRHTFQVLTKRPGRMRSLLGRATWADEVNEAAARHLDLDGDALDWLSRVTWPLPNVWLGTSVEDQKWADIRIPALLDTPAAVRWISAEPLLGPVDLDKPRCDDHDRDEIVIDKMGVEWCGPCSGDGFSGELSYGHWLDPLNGGLAWVVVGGESGHGARPAHPDWFRTLRDQCRDAGVPFLFKQWGAHDSTGKRVGKGNAGRTLDGATHDEYPDAVS